MADITPIPPGAPGGAVPPMKKETGKVQPKKETVRISLPPKPTAAPTIKLPTLPPGGPTGAPSAVPLPATPAQAVSPRPPMPAAGAPRAAAAAPMAQSRPAPAAAKPAPVAVPSTIGTLDKILAMAAMVAALFAVGSVIWMGMILKDATQ